MDNQVDIENDGGMIEEEKFDLERNFSSISESGSIREPLLKSKSRVNNTSQIAIVGANVYPIESLDYEYESFLSKTNSTCRFGLCFPTCSFLPRLPIQSNSINYSCEFSLCIIVNSFDDDDNTFFFCVTIDVNRRTKKMNCYGKKSI